MADGFEDIVDLLAFGKEKIEMEANPIRNPDVFLGNGFYYRNAALKKPHSYLVHEAASSGSTKLRLPTAVIMKPNQPLCSQYGTAHMDFQKS